jgi:hypothetical protein
LISIRLLIGAIENTPGVHCIALAELAAFSPATARKKKSRTDAKTPRRPQQGHYRANPTRFFTNERQ